LILATDFTENTDEIEQTHQFISNFCAISVPSKATHSICG